MEEKRVSITGACRRRWWTILLVAAVALAVSGALTARQARRYRANALLAVTPNSRVESSVDVMRSLETLERRTVVATFARVAATREIRDAAAARLGLEPPELSAYHVSAAVLPNTNVIRLDVAGPDPERAAQVANAAAAALHPIGRQLYRIYSLDVVGHAAPPRRPFHPDVSRNVLTAALIGLFLGVVLACALDAALLRRTPQSPGR